LKATGFNHVSIVARDLQESLAFYQDLFGLDRLPSPNFGFPVAWLQVGDLQLHLFEWQEEPPVRQHLAFAVDDFEGLYARADEAGYFDTRAFGHHLFELPNAIVQLYLRDPADNLIEVDAPHADTLPPSIRSEIRRLADSQPQSAENLRSTLFPSVLTG